MNVTSKVGSRDRRHIPKQSNVKIFNDTDYIKATRVNKKTHYLWKVGKVIPVFQKTANNRGTNNTPRRNLGDDSAGYDRPKSLVLQRVQEDDQDDKRRSVSR